MSNRWRHLCGTRRHWGEMLETDTHVLFYGAQDAFSNFHPARFTYEGRTFHTSEQCFMYMKARLFNDADLADRIAAEPKPGAAKALGRKVRGFKEAVWLGHRKRLMVAANLSKYTQSPLLAGALLATGTKALAEASPTDRIWGIGLSAADPRAKDPTQWRGLNLLGQSLHEVRGAIASIVAHESQLAARARSTRPPAEPVDEAAKVDEKVDEDGFVVVS